MSLSDYERGYRAGQRRAIEIMARQRNFGIDAAERTVRVELAQPIPPDPMRPPEGWYVFGTHVDVDVRLEFSEEHDSGGDPLWEKPAEGWGADDPD